MEHSAMPPVNPDGENEVAKDDNAAEPTVCRDWRIWLENVISPYRDEVREVVKLAVPVLLSEAMTFMITVVSMIFCGHLGKTEFAGVSLAVGVVNVTGISIGIGLSLTCDTLISQTYGSGNLRRVGVILQRGILILLLACFPCWAVLINTEPILLAVKQSPEVASLSQLYVKIFMPALPATFMYQLQMRYLQNQGIIWPQVIAGAVGNVLNAILNYILIFLLDLGVAGSAAANSISQYVLTVVLYIYIYGRGLHKATWAGWSLDCLQEWALFIKLAIPSMLMLCLKRWLLEVGAFLAGVISDVELGAHSIIYQLNVVAFMIPLGFTAVASLRVGKALGAGNIAQAKLSSKVPIICACIISCIVGTAVSLARHNIGFIFTKESDILHRVADVMITFGFIHVADGTAVVIGGIIRGTGKPLVGALCNLVGYFFIGFPIGVSLMFPRKMGILGLWIGFTTCAILQLIFYIVYLCKLDWEKAAKEALVRAGVEVTEENEMVEMDNMDSSQTEDQSSTAPRNGDDAREDQTQPEEHITNQNVSATTTVGEVLSVKQLVIRRGLALLIMVIILVAGIVLSGVFIHLLK